MSEIPQTDATQRDWSYDSVCSICHEQIVLVDERVILEGGNEAHHHCVVRQEIERLRAENASLAAKLVEAQGVIEFAGRHTTKAVERLRNIAGHDALVLTMIERADETLCMLRLWNY